MPSRLSTKKADVSRIFQAAVAAHVSGNMAQALSLYRRILEFRSNHIPALNNLGAIYLQSGDIKRAVDYLKKAIALKPDNVDALNNLGVLLNDSGNHQGAVTYFKKAVQLNPFDAELQTNLGSSLKALKKLEAAEACHRKAIDLDPKNAKAYNNLALLYKETGNMDSAIFNLHEALKLDPDDEKIYFNLADTLVAVGQLEEAATISEHAILRFPNSITTLVGASRVSIECGLWEKADPIIESAIQYPFTASDLDVLRHLLLFLNASAGKKQDIARLHFTAGRLIQEKTVEGAGRSDFDFRGCFQEKDKIRIGYVSPDFNRHSVGYFFREIIKHHNHNRFDIFCYFISDIEDEITHAIKAHATAFRRVRHLNNIDIAQQIYTDRIQILVDLAGYTRNSRLDIFALKPAPIQVTAIGYPHGSGLSAMDYRLTDQYAEGTDARQEYQEILLSMPGCFLPFPQFELPEQEIAREQLGIPEDHVVFVSFNAWHKLRPEVLSLWNQVLMAVPNSCLVLSFRHAETGYAQQRIRSYFKVVPNRLHFFGQTDTDIQHRARYLAADLALDPFPYNGTTTSWEALFMGVPVITLKGDRHVQRTTYSLLANLGLEWLAVDDESSYADMAVSLANDPEKRERLKQELQHAVRKVLQAGNTDYVESLELNYQEIWKRYDSNAPSA